MRAYLSLRGVRPAYPLFPPLLHAHTAGVQARKLSVGGEPVPWLLGLEPCDKAPARFYSRALVPTPTRDTRVWTVVPSKTAPDVASIRNAATGRCLHAVPTATSASTVALLPCDAGNAAQRWRFEKGMNTVTPVTSEALGLALAVANSTLAAALHGKDPTPVSDVAYGEFGLMLVPPYIQENCTTRNCQNYDPTQMWYYSPRQGLLRQATYAPYPPPKTPTITHTHTHRHYCLLPIPRP